MERIASTALAAALALGASNVWALSASNGQFTVTSDASVSDLDSLGIVNGTVVANSSLFQVASQFNQISLTFGYALDFQPAPNFVITGYDVEISVSGYAGSYSGPMYDADPPANAQIVSAAFGGAYFDPDHQQTQFIGGHFGSGSHISDTFWLSATGQLFCTVPVSMCYDPGTTGAEPAGAWTNYVNITPTLVSTVPEPATAALLMAGLTVAARRRRVSGL